MSQSQQKLDMSQKLVSRALGHLTLSVFGKTWASEHRQRKQVIVNHFPKSSPKSAFNLKHKIKIDTHFMCFSIAADVCWHSSDVHREKFSPLLPGRAERKRVQPAQAVHPQVLQLDQGRHALSERSQICSCTLFSVILTFYIVLIFSCCFPLLYKVANLYNSKTKVNYGSLTTRYCFFDIY